MSCKSWFIHLSGRLAVAMCLATTVWAGTFGKVVSIGGHASDLALDEPRGVLYISNFTANRIEVMSLADQTIERSINVAAQPGSLALSPDGKYLVVTHYGNFQAPSSPNNVVTVLDVDSGAKQTYPMGKPPLGVAFGVDGNALIVTTSEFILFEPSTGNSKVIQTVSGLTAKLLPQPAGTAPAEIVATSIGSSAGGRYLYGVTDSFEFRYDSQEQALHAGNYKSSPELGPRAVSVSADGSYWMSGWTLNDADFWVISQFPNITGKLSVGSVLIDSRRNLIYAQMGEINATVPVLYVTDADNLTIRERLLLQENLSGKSVLSSDGNTAYSVSESGVTVLPVGQLNKYPRLSASKQALLFRGNACDRSLAVQDVTIQSDGGSADFRLTSDNPAVRVSPSAGTAPATVRITVDSSAFLSQKGTALVTLKIESGKGVNQPAPIQVFVNSRESDQRGAVIPVEGKLIDILADPESDRFFVLREDKNQVLVFDGTNMTQTDVLRTYNTPTSMAITFDRKYLLVGCNNSHLINVYDLATLQAQPPIRIADYVQSIATSAGAILAATRTSSGGSNKIHRVYLDTRSTAAPPTLGVFENKIVTDTVLAGSENGRSILIAQSDGTLMLYDAVQDTFTVSRKEAKALVGAYAASNFDKFVVGEAILNSSLVPEKRLETDSGKTAGFAFLGQDAAFRMTAPSASAPGVLARLDVTTGTINRPTRTIEAPILGFTDHVFTRTLAPLASRTAIVALTTSGITALPWTYDAASVPPRINKVVNAADLTQPVAPGGLIAVLGNDLSPVAQASKQTPLPTVLGETCLTVNGTPVPMMLVSPQRINAQLPVAVSGSTTVVLRTSGGISDNFNVTILPVAPSVFRSGIAGPNSDLPTIVRATNSEIVTVSNPIHRGDAIVIYATGLGATSPAVEAGMPAPSEPLAAVVFPPSVSLGGIPVEVFYAGLVPGEVGVYQINVRIHDGVPTGMSVPLEISQGTAKTSIPVRVVN